jgi:hypothetical protein
VIGLILNRSSAVLQSNDRRIERIRVAFRVNRSTGSSAKHQFAQKCAGHGIQAHQNEQVRFATSTAVDGQETVPSDESVRVQKHAKAVEFF